MKKIIIMMVVVLASSGSMMQARRRKTISKPIDISCHAVERKGKVGQWFERLTIDGAVDAFQKQIKKMVTAEVIVDPNDSRELDEVRNNVLEKLAQICEPTRDQIDELYKQKAALEEFMAKIMPEGYKKYVQDVKKLFENKIEELHEMRGDK